MGNCPASDKIPPDFSSAAVRPSCYMPVTSQSTRAVALPLVHTHRESPGHSPPGVALGQVSEGRDSVGWRLPSPMLLLSTSFCRVEVRTGHL